MVYRPTWVAVPPPSSDTRRCPAGQLAEGVIVPVARYSSLNGTWVTDFAGRAAGSAPGAVGATLSHAAASAPARSTGDRRNANDIVASDWETGRLHGVVWRPTLGRTRQSPISNSS